MRTPFLSVVLFAAVAVPAPLAAQARMIVIPGIRGVPPTQLIDTMGTPREVPFPMKRVFAALEKVYAELKIKTDIHAEPDQIGNQAFFARGKFAGHRMSALFECGSGMTGPFADAYRIYMGLVSFVSATPANSSIVRTVLIGSAINVSEGVRPTQQCRSVGELELRMHEMMVRELTRIE